MNTSYKETMNETVKEFYNTIIKKKTYWIPVLFFSVLAYGFSITNRTVSIDDLASDIYSGHGNAMLSATRWGMLVWNKVMASRGFAPFTNRFLAVCFLICGAVIMSCVGYTLKKRKNVWIYTIFSVILITYPLINEIFEYNGANMIVGGNLLLAAVSLLFQITFQGKAWKKILFPSLLLSVVVSSYESGAFVYVLAVCIYLFCKYCVEKEKLNTKTQWLKEGIGFAAPLASAVLLRIIIGLFLIRILGLTYEANGNTVLSWRYGIKQVKELIYLSLVKYGVNAIIYFPIGLFLVMVILFIIYVLCIAIKQHRILPILLGCAVGVSLFLQSIIQGTVMPYRTAQTLSLFVAFMSAAIVEFAFQRKNKCIRAVFVVSALWVCLRQSVYLNQISALNNQRSTNEMAVVHQIGSRLKMEYDDKTVVFVGFYDMGDWISSQITVDERRLNSQIYSALRRIFDPSFEVEQMEFIDTNVNSILNWSTRAFDSQKMMKEYFSYCGYDIQVLESYPEKLQEHYNKIAKKEGIRPFEIRDMGDYIMVCIGELE